MICKLCGKEFATRRRSSFCSNECRLKYWSKYTCEKQKEKKRYRTCEYCGKDYDKQKQGTNKFCSDECRDKHTSERKYFHNSKRTTTYEKVCEVCGTKFTTNRANKKYCSETCKKKNETYLWKLKPYIIKTCASCGKEFKTKQESKIYCSSRCSAREYYRSNKTKEFKPSKQKNYTIKTCEICGEDFKAFKNTSIICSICAYKHKTTQSELPNQCAWCGKYIKNTKALCKECYEKAPHRFEKSMVDFSE